jgi:hypothetical protein
MPRDDGGQSGQRQCRCFDRRSGRAPDASELYTAHFLGADGAAKFLSALSTNPDQSAAGLCPARRRQTVRFFTTMPETRAALARSWP